MKTALTEWFDELKANYPYMANEIFDKGFNKYLEKEKEQIKDAYNHNMTGFDKLEQEEIGLNWAEDYYNQTYNQKQIIIDIMKADEEDGLYNQNK
jgi:hypothetical protein